MERERERERERGREGGLQSRTPTLLRGEMLPNIRGRVHSVRVVRCHLNGRHDGQWIPTPLVAPTLSPLPSCRFIGHNKSGGRFEGDDDSFGEQGAERREGGRAPFYCARVFVALRRFTAPSIVDWVTDTPERRRDGAASRRRLDFQA